MGTGNLEVETTEGCFDDGGEAVHPATLTRQNSWDAWAKELYEKHLNRAGGDHGAANQAMGLEAAASGKAETEKLGAAGSSDGECVVSEGKGKAKGSESSDSVSDEEKVAAISAVEYMLSFDAEKGTLGEFQALSFEERWLY